MDTQTKLNLLQINQLTEQDFIDKFSEIIEHSPWVAKQLWQEYRPFSSLEQLFNNLVTIINLAGAETWQEILNLHPELSGKEAQAGNLTDFSTSEQAGLGLNHLTKEEFLKITEFNQRYRQKFSFPFVVCVRLLKSREQLFLLQQQRYQNSYEDEIKIAISQVYQIARIRLETMFAQSISDKFLSSGI